MDVVFLMERVRIRVKGRVQGVGFRPHVYRLALSLGLTGFVRNDGSGVLIEAQGVNVSVFATAIEDQQPPLSKIQSMQTETMACITGEEAFLIASSSTGLIDTQITPDACVCQACLTELFDSQSRYYRYPFLNCTHCGPRFSIVERLPYDRANTSMRAFCLCTVCQSEYRDPLNRRYHAQPIACPDCGPQYSQSIEAMAKQLKQGKILAIKSIGGYQLVCDAHNKEAVLRLRKRKKRMLKPFAAMALNTASAKRYVSINASAKNALIGHTRPICLLNIKSGAPLLDAVAPDLKALGIMLPYTPLHYLLFHALLNEPRGIQWLNASNDLLLIVTSGNMNGQAIITDDQEAMEDLATVADAVIAYNREIVSHVDDAVVKPIGSKHILIRRARSFCPQAISLPHEVPTTLALGGELKNTICLTRGKEAYISQHIGDLTSVSAIKRFHHTIEQFLKLFNVKPQRIACDLHPEFYTSQVAYEYQRPVIRIQHHHAHISACMAEHRVAHRCLALALDGYGLGIDGKAWGGELFLVNGLKFERLGHFYPLRLPGGDRAASEPWRMAASVLYELDDIKGINSRFAHQQHAPHLIELLRRGVNTPLTSSCGRLFDAASALLGICEYNHYEGEAAIKLEQAVNASRVNPGTWDIRNNIISFMPLMQQLIHCEPTEGANLFHSSLAEGLAQWLTSNGLQHACDTIVLSGGCFQNKILCEALSHKLKANFNILLPVTVPANDGGLSLGQAWIAGNRSKEKDDVFGYPS